jgi:hypothetical protein
MEEQIVGDPSHQRIECRIACEAEDVVDVVVLVRPVHRLDAAVMAVAAPHDAGGRPMPSQMLRHVLDDGSYLGAFRGARCAQDGRDRRPARHVIDVMWAVLPRFEDLISCCRNSCARSYRRRGHLWTEGTMCL